MDFRDRNNRQWDIQGQETLLHQAIQQLHQTFLKDQEHQVQPTQHCRRMVSQEDSSQDHQHHQVRYITNPEDFIIVINFSLSFQVTKEQEAAASAYYDPRAPNSAFVQQPQFYENPPAYSELDHKKQQ